MCFLWARHIVNRTGGTIFLSPVIDAIDRVKSGVDKTVAELAIIRIQKEIEGLKIQKEALPCPPTQGCFYIMMILLVCYPLL